MSRLYRRTLTVSAARDWPSPEEERRLVARHVAYTLKEFLAEASLRNESITSHEIVALAEPHCWEIRGYGEPIGATP